MKHLRALLLAAILLPQFSFAQKMSISDLTSICGQNTWEQVDKILLAKNWTYFQSRKGDDENFDIISWSFNKSFENDKARGWFSLYTYEGNPVRLAFECFEKNVYTSILGQLGSSGFKLIESDISDDIVSSTYANQKYLLTVLVGKEESDNYYESSSFTSYTFRLTEKSSIYDPSNGRKYDYYDNGTLKGEYSLVDGKLNGPIVSYHENGNIKKRGYYVNDIENGYFQEFDIAGLKTVEYNKRNGVLDGPFKEYDESARLQISGEYKDGKLNGNYVEYYSNGRKSLEYSIVNEKKSGIENAYTEDGKLIYSTEYLSGSVNGKHTQFFYDENSGELQLKEIGFNKNGVRNGVWQLLFIDKNSEIVLELTTYKEGLKSGAFQEISGDTIVIGEYLAGDLNGRLTKYIDLNRMILGHRINPDTGEAVLIVDQFFRNGLRHGSWKGYSLSGKLICSGYFSNGKKDGEWRYYYENVVDQSGTPLPFSEQLFLIETYSDGKRSGKSVRYSTLDEESLKFIKMLETSTYENDELNGPYEYRDSSNSLILSGTFLDGHRNGNWTEKHAFFDSTMQTYHWLTFNGNYRFDQMDGPWNQWTENGMLLTTINYYSGELHGEYVIWNKLGLPNLRRTYYRSELKTIERYIDDSNILNYKIELIESLASSAKWNFTVFGDTSDYSQIYTIWKTKSLKHDVFESSFLKMLVDNDQSIGYKDGLFVERDKNDRPLAMGVWMKEKRIGNWVSYYYDQNVKLEEVYVDNSVSLERYWTLSDTPYSGLFVTTTKKNNQREVRKVKDGVRNGKTKFYDLTTGELLKTEGYKDGIAK